MVSIRTKYRLKRVQFIGDSITDLAKILLSQKRILEQVHLKYFKRVKKDVDELAKQVNRIRTVPHT